MRRFPKLSFSVKFSLAISALAVSMMAISVSFMYAQLYSLLVRQTAGRLKDVGQTGSFLFDAAIQERVLRLKAASEERARLDRSRLSALAAGETLTTLTPEVAEQLMASEDFQALVQIMRRTFNRRNS